MHYLVCAAGVYIEGIGLRTIWWRNDSGENELGIRGTQMGPFFVWALINDHFWIFFIHALNKRNI